MPLPQGFWDSWGWFEYFHYILWSSTVTFIRTSSFWNFALSASLWSRLPASQICHKKIFSVISHGLARWYETKPAYLIFKDQQVYVVKAYDNPCNKIKIEQSVPWDYKLTTVWAGWPQELNCLYHLTSIFPTNQMTTTQPLCSTTFILTALTKKQRQIQKDENPT